MAGELNLRQRRVTPRVAVILVLLGLLFVYALAKTTSIWHANDTASPSSRNESGSSESKIIWHSTAERFMPDEMRSEIDQKMSEGGTGRPPQ